MTGPGGRPDSGDPRVRAGIASTDIVGYVPGAWDMFHIGHLNLIKRSRAQCDYLIVGVVTDEVLLQAKGKQPVVPLHERIEVVRSIDLVDAAVVDVSSDKLVMWQQLHFDVIFKGDDWRGTPAGDRLEAAMHSVDVDVIYFPYTAHTSSTALRKILAG
jgi:glycerol-3-phosphate cytidylyltransferase